MYTLCVCFFDLLIRSSLCIIRLTFGRNEFRKMPHVSHVLSPLGDIWCHLNSSHPKVKQLIRKLAQIKDRKADTKCLLYLIKHFKKRTCCLNTRARTHTHTHTHTHIYIYIYIYVQISLNIIDIFCLHIFLLILSYCRIDFIVFGGN